MQNKVFATVIGGGAVGLSCARSISRRCKLPVLLLEKNQHFGQETSSRNSEVIHSSVYCTFVISVIVVHFRFFYSKEYCLLDPQGSLKSRLCLEGNRMLYKICKKAKIPHKKTGKLILSTESNDLDRMEKFTRTAQECGANFQVLTAEEVNEIEPNVKSYGGAYFPDSGVIDSHQYMQWLEADLLNSGADVIYRSKVVDLKLDNDTYVLSVQDEDGNLSTVESKYVVNSAGHNAPMISNNLGIKAHLSNYQYFPVKGQYMRVHKNIDKYPKTLVYPLPGDGIVGIHTCPDLGGGMRLGPYDEKTFPQDPEEEPIYDYTVSPSLIPTFGAEIRKMLPWVEDTDLEPDIAGIHPKMKPKHRETMGDFIISHEENWGFFGYFNLIGIESPGLTASPAIGKYVSQTIEALEYQGGKMMI